MTVMLKKSFAPVEQYMKSGDQGPWTDIYALGATMMYCLSGKAPHDALYRLNNPELIIDCSPYLSGIINKMMSVHKEGRFQNIKELKPELFKSFSMTVTTVNTEPEPEVPVAVVTEKKTGFWSSFIRKLFRK